MKTVLQLLLKEKDCAFTNESIDINYTSGRKESVLIKEVINGDKVTFFLNFKGDVKEAVSINIGDFVGSKIQYIPYAGIKLSNSKDAQTTKTNLDPRVLREDFQKVISDLLPDAKMDTVPNASWKKLLDFDSIHKIIERDRIDSIIDESTLSD